jgi:hypothetical protein
MTDADQDVILLGLPPDGQEVAIISADKYHLFKGCELFYSEGRVRVVRREGNRQVTTLLSHFVTSKPPPGFVKDHINLDPLDNRTSNLRDVIQSQNSTKRKKTLSNYIGVVSCNSIRNG